GVDVDSRNLRARDDVVEALVDVMREVLHRKAPYRRMQVVLRALNACHRLGVKLESPAGNAPAQIVAFLPGAFYSARDGALVGVQRRALDEPVTHPVHQNLAAGWHVLLDPLLRDDPGIGLGPRVVLLDELVDRKRGDRGDRDDGGQRLAAGDDADTAGAE